VTGKGGLGYVAPKTQQLGVWGGWGGGGGGPPWVYYSHLGGGGEKFKKGGGKALFSCTLGGRGGGKGDQVR